MKLTFLGTCSGTEPMPGRKHVSFVIEQNGGVYWFDAGEGCSYTAHLAGIDLLSVRAVFITHTHLDHTGGLANLIWTMKKLNGLAKDTTPCLSGKSVRVFIPNLSVWEGVLKVAAGVKKELEIDFDVDARRYQDGVIYDDSILRVIALHNEHLGIPEESCVSHSDTPPSTKIARSRSRPSACNAQAGQTSGAAACYQDDARTLENSATFSEESNDWQSYSFRIETTERSVVYSGDVANIRELEPILEKCDLLLMETGHHKVADVCTYLKDCGRSVGRLAFIHHGREILDDPEREGKKARDILGEEVIVADDGMTLAL